MASNLRTCRGRCLNLESMCLVIVIIRMLLHDRIQQRQLQQFEIYWYCIGFIPTYRHCYYLVIRTMEENPQFQDQFYTVVFWNVFSCLLSCIPYDYVITQYSLTIAVIGQECFQLFAITYSLLLCYYTIPFDKDLWWLQAGNVFSCLLSHIPCYGVITQYRLTKIFGGDKLGMFLAVCYRLFLITVLLHNSL